MTGPSSSPPWDCCQLLYGEEAAVPSWLPTVLKVIVLLFIEDLWSGDETLASLAVWDPELDSPNVAWLPCSPVRWRWQPDYYLACTHCNDSTDYTDHRTGTADILMSSKHSHILDTGVIWWTDPGNCPRSIKFNSCENFLERRLTFPGQLAHCHSGHSSNVGPRWAPKWQGEVVLWISSRAAEIFVM